MKILIVDDQRSTRLILRKVVEDIHPDIEIADFEKPLEALEWSREHAADLVLLDYRMPEMNGLQFARQFRRPPAQRDVPIVLISVIGDDSVRQAALDTGVTEFLVKPVRPRELLARCRNLLALRRHAEATKQRVHALEHELVQGREASAQRERATLLALAQAAQLRHGDAMHLVRTARFAALIAERLGLTSEAVRRLELATPLHDIGMLAVPDSILGATGALDAAQLRTLREHTCSGAELLRHGTDPVLRLARVLALSHHEHWDGSGYPHALCGTEIPLEARIVALADVFDRLISPRPQRTACSLDAAVEYVRDRSGSAFDPACVRVMLSDGQPLMAISRMKFSQRPAFEPREEKRRA